MIRRYLVVLENGRGRTRATNLSGFVPDVPGCWSTGATLEELRGNLHIALTLHLEMFATNGQPMPEPIMGMDDVPADCFGEWMAVKHPVTKSSLLKKIPKKSPGESEWDFFLRSPSDFLRGRTNFV